MTDLTADRIALRDLVEAYAYACDTRDGGLLRRCFTQGATLTVHWVDREAATLVFPDGADRIPEGLARYDLTFHFVGNHRATIVGDHATGHTYCIAHHVTGTSNQVMTIRYDDTYRREPDGWKFTERHLRHLWTEHTNLAR